MFSGNLTTDLDQSWHSSMESDEEDEKLAINAKENKDNDKRTLHLLTLSQFIRYFSINRSEEHFFEDIITKLAVLTSIQHFCVNGLTFNELLQELQQANFFVALEITDKEPNSVMSAQMALQILLKIQLLHPTDFSVGVKDVNDMDHIPQDEEHGLLEGRE